MGLLDGKVAIITGAGGGIGRCHALLFAEEGAKVVVNDLGGACDGTGGGGAMADKVVAEINEAGGEAVANYGSVATAEGAASILKTAIDAYGRADILVNNAGILRDKTFLKLEEANWDLVIAVHLKGTFLCSQAFAGHVRERADAGDKGGRIVNTSSYAGLIGNYGQTNYAAAKAGIYALTKVWALELAKIGVTVNCVAPMAKTRMTHDIAMVPDTMKAEHISPMVLYLASDLAKDVSGKVYGVHGQQLLEYKMLMTDGVTKAGDALWTPSEIHEQLEAIGADTAPQAPASGGAAAPLTDEEIIAKAFARLPEVFVPDRAKGWSAVIQFDITGGEPWTITVADGVCTTAPGKHGAATCVVTVDKKTYAEIVKGKQKAEKAFMAGKIKATNLGDMMKFGGAFDMKKAKALAEAEAAAAPRRAAAPSPAKPSSAEIIDKAFTLLPEVFVPARAKGWSATIVFDIQGANPWTIEVKDGVCTTKQVKADSPTCVVTVDKDTYAAIVKGEEKPEKAFMAGKIKATNLGDMMKFGSAFDMKKAREVAKAHAKAHAKPVAAAAASATPAGPRELVARAFLSLPLVFRPDSVSGWNAVIHFDITGGEPWTVAIKDGTCVTSRGKEGDATCVVTVKLEDYAKVVSGELRAEQAFMQQRIKATDLSEMMRFGRAFDMKKAKALLDSAAPAPKSAGPGTGMNRACLGRTYCGEEPQFLRPEHGRLFAEATQDANPAYRGEGAGTLVPPMVAVRYLKDVMFRAVGDEELNADVLNLVHGEQDMIFHKPLRQWDLCAARARLTAIEDKSTGQLLRMTQTLLVDGDPAVEVRASMFIRDPSRSRGKRDKAQAKPAEEVKHEIAFSSEVTVADDQGPRYAEAGQDNNPIHTDDAVAKLAGFPGIILQGLCTLSFASKGVIDELLGGDSTRLKRLAARFTKPVLMGDVLTTEGWRLDEKDGARVYGFHVVNQSGEEVIAGGVAELVDR